MPMPTTVTELAIVVLFASAASGQAPAEQSVDRVFHFTHTKTTQGVQEIATVMRTIAGIRQLSVDTVTTALALHGSAGQIALAEWLFNELDRPASGPSLDQQGQTESHQYQVPGGSDVVRVFYLTHTEAAPALQEIVTAIRARRLTSWLGASIP